MRIEPMTTPTPRGERRVLYVSDPSSIAINMFPDPVEEPDLRRWVDTVADSGVDTFDQEVFSQGWTVYWRSENVEYDQRHQHRRFLPMFERGTTPLEVLIDQCRKRDLNFIAGFRVNDNHAFQARQQGLAIAGFIESNPDLCMQEFPPGDFFRNSEPLDFTHDRVRQFTADVIDEVVNRFDVDGIELCMRDHAYFPPGAGRQRSHLMTDLIRKVRGLLNDVGVRKGRKLVLGVRVPATIDECADLGLDVPAWISEGLIDHLSPQDSMYTDFNLPYEPWAHLTRTSDCMLYPVFQPWSSYRRRTRLEQIMLSSANVRALAHTFYGAGADGISVYNHFCTYWNEQFYPYPMQIFHQLRDPKIVAAGERHYIFDPTWDGVTGFGGDGRASTGAVKANRLVLPRQKGASGTYALNLYEDLSLAFGAMLLFRGFGLLENDELEVSLNGRRIPDGDIGRTRATQTPLDWNHIRKAGGRKIKCIPEQARLDVRADDELPFSTRWFSLKHPVLRRGDNRLEVRLANGDPSADTTESIVIDEVEVWVMPRVSVGS